MTDEREEIEKSRDAMGKQPTSHSTFEEPTGADAVGAEPKPTITDGGLTPTESADKP